MTLSYRYFPISPLEPKFLLFPPLVCVEQLTTQNTHDFKETQIIWGESYKSAVLWKVVLLL